jgi:hypothetical protein
VNLTETHNELIIVNSATFNLPLKGPEQQMYGNAGVEGYKSLRANHAKCFGKSKSQ